MATDQSRDQPAFTVRCMIPSADGVSLALKDPRAADGKCIHPRMAAYSDGPLLQSLMGGTAVVAARCITKPLWHLLG